jgi:hypothetical protein
VEEPWVAVREALRECARTPVWARSSGDLVEGLDAVQVLASQVAALGLGLLREIDGRGIPAAQGAANTAAWLRDRYRLSPGTASRRVGLAAALDAQLPQTRAALSTGAINVEQAHLIAKTIPTLPAEYRSDGEKVLVEQCVSFGPKELGRLATRLLDHLAPEAAQQRTAQRLARDEQRAYDNRGLHLTDVPGWGDGDARVRISGWLDPESASVVRAAIDPWCAPRPDSAEPDRRGPAQRRADALVDVCRLAMACGELPDNGGERPQLAVTIDFDTLRTQVGAATLDDGTLISPAAARRLACDARVLPAVLGGAGQVLDLGRERRLFTGPVRRALVLRDRGCAFPGCDRPPRWCHAHHVVSWLDGGSTGPDNGVLLCGHHHRTIHQGHWQVSIAADGLPEFIPPEYLDPQRQPRRNTYHRRE